MREAFEAWYGKHYSKYALLSWNGKEYDNNDTELGWQAFRAAIAHQNQEAAPIYEIDYNSENIWQAVHSDLFGQLKQKYPSRIIYLAPPQPQSVKGALEAAANICDERIKKIEIAINDEDDENEAMALKSIAWQFLVTASEIRALIK